MMHKLIILIIGSSFLFNQTIDQKEYYREFYDNGSIKTEGWKMNNQKVDYWFTYFPNGKISAQGHFINNKKAGYWYFYSTNNKLIKEGHFINDKAEKWWIIYDIADNNKKNQIIRKYQYRNNQKNGYCLWYKNDKLFKAEKYINDKKTGEWTDAFSFKKDNPNVSL
ncbi:toxin-antitoxin system YwqK family antitoxin [Aquimarina sp. 2201CG14-23]|uniref:toxin-antitoxin system YwqK family antitoxin n=1 Tax=Aquimarina mycalae TaxID=3040073 RepID=UPI002477D7BC|nr:hypothetical protein [Aquimarina sp. 2201CG14-23]MDH7447972.1 hypothetical protein [Aquimarina sp. 2201CG14-23]